MILDFNANWRFWKKGGTPVSVCLPHDAMLSEQRKADCRNGVNTGYFPGGYYFYEKAFALTAQEAEKSVVIHFEGVYQRAAVFCNGQKAAFHHYGYMQDWVARLDAFLQFNEEEVLHHKGKVTTAIAKAFAESEFEKYRVIQDRQYQSDFDRLVASTEEKD